jgi:hypothetical protein
LTARAGWFRTLSLFPPTEFSAAVPFFSFPYDDSLASADGIGARPLCFFIFSQASPKLREKSRRSENGELF